MLRRLADLIQVAVVGEKAMVTAIARQRARVGKANEAGAVTQMIPP
jgi:DNA repair ATPase RecN